MAICELPEDVKCAIRSGINVASTSQCITELVLNSIDAGATSIAVRVDLRYFILKVIDNGVGITLDELDKVGTRYMTSKCHSLQDLQNNLKYFGFRGEAIASLRKLSGVLMIETRPANCDETYCKAFSHDISHAAAVSKVQRPASGTTISISDFMYNMPVRRKRIQETLDLEEIKHEMECIALMHPEISFSLRNDANGNVVMQTKKYSDVIQVFSNLFGETLSKCLKPVYSEFGKFKVSGYIGIEAHSQKNRQFIYVNKRLVLKTKLHKLINAMLAKTCILRSNGPWQDAPISKAATARRFLAFPSPDKRDKFAVFVLNVECTYSDYDICLEPNKSLIEFRDWDSVLQCVEQAIRMFIKSESLTTIEKNMKNKYVTNDISVIEEMEELAKESALNYNSETSVKNENDVHTNINKKIGHKLVNVEGALHGLTAKRKQASTAIDEVDDALVRKNSSCEKLSTNVCKIKKYDFNITTLTEDPFHSSKISNRKPPEKLFKITLSQPLFSNSAVVSTNDSLRKEMGHIKKRDPPVKLKHFAFSPEKKMKLSNVKSQNEGIQVTENYKPKHSKVIDKSDHLADPNIYNNSVISQKVNRDYGCVSVQVGSPLNRCSVGTSTTDIDGDFKNTTTAKLSNHENFYQNHNTISCSNNNESPDVLNVSCQTSFVNSHFKNVVSQGTDCTDLLSNKSSADTNSIDSTKENEGNSEKSNKKYFKLHCIKSKHQAESQTKVKHVTFQMKSTSLTEEKTLNKVFSYKPPLGYSDEHLASSSRLHKKFRTVNGECEMNEKKFTSSSMLTDANLRSDLITKHTINDKNIFSYVSLEKNVNNQTILNLQKEENTSDEHCSIFNKTNPTCSQRELCSDSLGYSSSENNKTIINDRARSPNTSDYMCPTDNSNILILSCSDFHVSSVESPVVRESNSEICNESGGENICEYPVSQFSVFNTQQRLENVEPKVSRSEDVHVPILRFENCLPTVNNLHNNTLSATTVISENQEGAFTKSQTTECPIFHFSHPDSEVTVKNISCSNCIPFSSSSITGNVTNQNSVSFKQVSFPVDNSPYFNKIGNSSIVPGSNKHCSETNSPESEVLKTTVSVYTKNKEFNEKVSKNDNTEPVDANNSVYPESKNVLNSFSVTDSQIETDQNTGASSKCHNTCGSGTTQELMEVFDNVMNNLVDSDISVDCTSHSTTQNKTYNESSVESDENVCKITNINSDCNFNNQCNNLWRTAYDDKGAVFYVHKSGITSYKSPVLSQNQVTFSISERRECLPKGMSPIMESTTLNLPQLSQSSLHKIDNVMLSKTLNHTDEDITVKWRNEFHTQETGHEDIVSSTYSNWNFVKKFCEPEVPNSEILDKFTIEVNNVMFNYNFTKDMFCHMKILGQLDRKFIVAVYHINSNNSDKAGYMLLLFDQHAVHERIRLETLMKEYCFDMDCSKFKYTGLSENLLLVVDHKETRLLSSFHEEFNRLGLYYNILSDTEIQVTKIPTCLHNRIVREGTKGQSVLKKNLESLIREHVDVLLNTRGVGSRVPNTLHNIISSEACRGALKFGDILTVDNSKILLKQLAQCDCPFQCAHGRPSLVPIADLDSIRKRQDKVSRKPQLSRLKTVRR